MKKLQYIGTCLRYGSILSLHNTSVQVSRNPQRVSEAVQESAARINVIVPGHPDRLPGAERITPIIYVWGGQAESIRLWEQSPEMVEKAGRIVVEWTKVAQRTLLGRPLVVSNFIPLRKNVLFGQGIVLSKFNEKPGFSCN